MDERRALAGLAQMCTNRRDGPYPDTVRWTLQVLGLEHLQVMLSLPRDDSWSLRKEHAFANLSYFFENQRDHFPEFASDLIRPVFVSSYYLDHLVGQERDAARKRIGFTLARYLTVLGFEARIEFDKQGVEGIRVEVLPTELVENRRQDHTRLHEVLLAVCPPAYAALTGAFDRYMDEGEDAPRQAIDSCRNACENLFKSLAGKEKWGDSFDAVVGGSVETLAKSVYGYLSGTGTHSKKTRTREDALLAIRLTEDILRAVLVRAGRW